ncbi:MAG: twin-arginine translocase subunit TatC [Chitinophagaceae bacterium]|nr:twin-arginine translocase subunit TatC [Chitinophagaceae bacterium]
MLTTIGLLTHKFFTEYRRHAIVVILILAAIITPTTDPFSLGIVTIPLYILYEAGIIIATRIGKEKESNKEWS